MAAAPLTVVTAATAVQHAMTKLENTNTPSCVCSSDSSILISPLSIPGRPLGKQQQQRVVNITWDSTAASCQPGHTADQHFNPAVAITRVDCKYALGVTNVREHSTGVAGSRKANFEILYLALCCS